MFRSRPCPRAWGRAGAVAALLSLCLPVAGAGQQSLTVFAAASLGDAYRALGVQFAATHPGVAVQFNFAGSQQLVLQLLQGARADLFASADERWMQVAVDSGLIAGSPENFAHNSLVVIVPRANPAGVTRLQDLSRRGIKLVLAAEVVPVGRYSRKVLEDLSRLPGYGARFGPQVLASTVSYEDNVKGIVAKVQLGEADAGIVYRSDAVGPIAAQLTVFDIPAAANVVATYPIAVLSHSGSPDLARAFLALVVSPAGQATLTRHGFDPPTPAPTPR